eukprot:EC714624.1.p1 GENE.EC714624.1~~EC714624.1.p1  ORF type:complete len:128 (+),score=8.23 EC714624.1:13-396(+)
MSDIHAVRQEAPPAGGYSKVEWQRNFGRKTPGGAVLLLGVAAVMAFGFYRAGEGNVIRREEKEEKRRARANIIPFLQAEEDRRYLAGHAVAMKAEAELMKNVEGWEVGKNVYNSGDVMGSSRKFPWS